jgi:hypothetical protein
MTITGVIPICVDYYGSTAGYSYYTSFTINNANTWQYVSITIPPPPSGAGSFSTASLSNKIAAIKFMHTTSTNVFQSVSNNTWSTTFNANNASAANLANSSWTRYLTGVQLEKGTIATPFEFRPFAVELQLCQRYFQSHIYYSILVVNNTNGYYISSNNLPVALRNFSTASLAPTVAFPNGNYNIAARGPTTLALLTNALSGGTEIQYTILISNEL